MPSLAREEKIIDDALERMHEMNRELINRELTVRILMVDLTGEPEKKKGRFDLIDLG